MRMQKFASHPQQAVVQFRHAVDCWQKLGRPYDHARTLSGLGRALAEAGDPGQARTTFDWVLSLTETLARQLDDHAVKAAFLNSPLVQETRAARAAVEATPSHTLSVQSTASTRPEQEQQVRFCTSPDGVRIAYATVGAGPPLVKAANWLSHLEFDWNSPVWRHWLIGLSQHHTLIRYDERGCGLSDWDVDDFSLDAWVQDLETVVETLGLDRFPLLGISQGGAIAIAYAVRHPERVSHLILYGAYARGRFQRNDSPQETELAQTTLKLMQLGWGQDNPAFRQFFTSLFMPEATTEQMRWFNDLQRVSASAAKAVRIRSAFAHLNVSELARKVAVPTLVLHARDDGAVPFEERRRLAALIPNAQLIALEGKNHILLESEPAWPRFLAEVHRFLEKETTDRSLTPAKSPADLPSRHS